MQYWQRKLQRSVTEIRTSPIGRPCPSTSGSVTLTAEARTTGRTGVEMEAMTACAVAALTVYDMVKGLERGVSIESVQLVAKSGGRSGEWRREA